MGPEEEAARSVWAEAAADDVPLGEGESPADDFLNPDIDVAGPQSVARLSDFHRRLLSRCFQANNFAEVAREMGCSGSYVRNLVRGHQAPWFRQAFQWMLYEAGLHPAQVTKGFLEATQALDYKWNHETKSWDAFPDNKTRLKAWENIAYLLDLEPPKNKGGGQGNALQVTINTNLGDGKPQERPGHYTIEASVPEGEANGDGR